MVIQVLKERNLHRTQRAAIPMSWFFLFVRKRIFPINSWIELPRLRSFFFFINCSEYNCMSNTNFMWVIGWVFCIVHSICKHKSSCTQPRILWINLEIMVVEFVDYVTSGKLQPISGFPFQKQKLTISSTQQKSSTTNCCNTKCHYQ